MTPGTLLLRSFRDVDVGNKNECSFDDFCKCIDSTVPWPNVQELWELWNGFFDCFCSEHMIQSRSCSSMRYLLFICHHCGQDGLTIADISSISHETQMQLSTLSSPTVQKNEACSATMAALEVSSSTAACLEALPPLPRVVAEGLRIIMSALLSSSYAAAFDRCRSFAVVKSSRIIMSSAWFLQAIADQHLKGEGSVNVLLFALLLNEADVHHSGTVPFEQLCQFMRAFQVTLALKDQTSQALAQYFSSADGSVDGFGKPVQDSTPIHYRNMLAHLRGAIPSLRQQKLQQLFHVLDRGNKGFITVADVSAALQYSMVSADAIRNHGHASAMLECSNTLIDSIAAVCSKTQAEKYPKSVCITEFVEFYHTLSISISRNPVFFAVLYKMWERGLENPGDLLDTGNMNFRPSKVFDAATATAQRCDARGEDHAPVSPFKQLLTDTDAPCNFRVAESPSKQLANQGSFIPASPDGFISRLQSPKLMDESNFSSRKGNPAVTAFDGAAGVSSASGTNYRMYSHLNRSSNHLPVQYDPEIDGFSTIRRKLVGISGDPSLAMQSGKNGVEGSADPDPLHSTACAGIFARVRGLLRQEHATNKYKSSHHSSLDSMKFVSRWNNFIWIAANVVIGDARSAVMSGASTDKAESSRGIQGTVTVERFSIAMNELSIYLTDTELALLGREFQSGQPGCLKYPRILKGLVSLSSQYRDNKKRLLWQGIETVSGFRGRVPLSNVFKAINVAGHPLVANHICDEGTFEALLHRVATH